MLKKIGSIFLLALVLPFLADSSLFALTFHVDSIDGDDGRTGLFWGDALRSVDEALSRSVLTPESDTINIAGGTYEENLVVDTSVTILGGFLPPSDDRDPSGAPTILSGGGTSTTVKIARDASSVVLDGLVIKDGRGLWSDSDGRWFGGGIDIANGFTMISGSVIEGNSSGNGGGVRVLIQSGLSEIRIEGNIIRNNSAALSGGAIYVTGMGGPFMVPVSIVNNGILGNTSDDGEDGCAGIWTDSSIGIMDNRIMENVGSGVVVAGDPFPLLFNNEITHNEGSGVIIESEGATKLSNCTVAYNGGDGVRCQFQRATVENSILYHNGNLDLHSVFTSLIDLTYSIVGSGFIDGGEGNLSVDPEFAVGPRGDVYLSCIRAGQAVESAAIDSGSESSVLLRLNDRTTRTDQQPDNGIVDRGYHYEIKTLDLYRGIEPDTLVVFQPDISLPYEDGGWLSSRDYPGSYIGWAALIAIFSSGSWGILF